MFNKVIGTLVSKVFLAFLSLLIVLTNSKQLGASGLGVISLVVLGITIINLVSNFVGGPALIYLIPRKNNFVVLIISYIWTFISTIIVAILLYLFNLVPKEFEVHVGILALINGFSSINSSILISKQKIRIYNLITLFQNLSIFSALIVLFFIFKIKTVNSYIISLYIGYFICFILSFFHIIRYIPKPNFNEVFSTTKDLFKYGSFGQVSSIMQLLNYRLSYYFIDFILGKTALGIYSLGVQLSEGIWLISKSIALVQYSHISNNNDEKKSIDLSVTFCKISVLASFLCILPLIFMPNNFFTFIFGKDFGNIGIVIILLAPGIISLSAHTIFTHFYSGTGRIYLNTIASGIGLIITGLFSYFLISKFQIAGAAIASTLSYFFSLVFHFAMFRKISKVKFKDFLITKKDFIQAKKLFKKS